jgi:hypothetical protein
LDPEQIKAFAARLAALEADDAEHEAVQQEFLEYAADFTDTFSSIYHDFAPRPDGNILCTMEDYVTPRKRVPFIIDSRTGFITPLRQDVRRGGKYQDM